MDGKSLTYLEFEKITKRLATHCVTPAGREAAKQLVPSSSLDEVLRWQGLTAEARRVRRLKANVFLSSGEDLTERVSTASRSGNLLASDIRLSASCRGAGEPVQTRRVGPARQVCCSPPRPSPPAGVPPRRLL